MPCGGRPLWPRRLLRPARLRTGRTAAASCGSAERPGAPPLGPWTSASLETHLSMQGVRCRLHQGRGLWCHCRLLSTAGRQAWAWWEADAPLQQKILRAQAPIYHVVTRSLFSARPLVRRVCLGSAVSETRDACARRSARMQGGAAKTCYLWVGALFTSQGCGSAMANVRVCIIGAARPDNSKRTDSLALKSRSDLHIHPPRARVTAPLAFDNIGRAARPVPSQVARLTVMLPNHGHRL
jgi:hypothetical protein